MALARSEAWTDGAPAGRKKPALKGWMTLVREGPKRTRPMVTRIQKTTIGYRKLTLNSPMARNTLLMERHTS